MSARRLLLDRQRQREMFYERDRRSSKRAGRIIGRRFPLKCRNAFHSRPRQIAELV
jgi:hypothetical protein